MSLCSPYMKLSQIPHLTAYCLSLFLQNLHRPCFGPPLNSFFSFSGGLTGKGSFSFNIHSIFIWRFLGRFLIVNLCCMNFVAKSSPSRWRNWSLFSGFTLCVVPTYDQIRFSNRNIVIPACRPLVWRTSGGIPYFFRRTVPTMDISLGNISNRRGWESLMNTSLRPYFFGLLGIYIQNLHRPLNPRSCSSILHSRYDLYWSLFWS